MDNKLIVSLIGWMLENKVDFRGEVVREALDQLVRDEPLSELLLRTAIISYQYHNELKQYVLTEVVPKVIQRKPWDTASSKLFDGVAYILNKLYGHKDVESTLRFVFALPLTQFKEVLSAAPLARRAIKAVYQRLSAAEQEMALAGRALNLFEADDAYLKEVVAEKRRLLEATEGEAA